MDRGAKKFKNLCFTAWEFKVETYQKKYDKITYLVVGLEVAPTTGKVHYQGFMQLNNAYGLRWIKETIGDQTAHIEAMRGTAEEAATYCKKDGNFFEWGQIRSQGERTDLDKVKTEILEGRETVDGITVEKPHMFHQYGRTLNKIEDIAMRRRVRNGDMTEGIWYYGKTGVGKSHKAFEGFDPKTHYVWPNEKNGWWDAYAQQETVILNDFRGEIPYNTMLQMIDKWPWTVPRRGREPIPFTSKKVIITSSLAPCEIYKKRDAEDDIAQLLRRLKVIYIDERGTEHEEASKEVLEGNTKPLAKELDGMRF